jgi:hypothetical protein
MQAEGGMPMRCDDLAGTWAGLTAWFDQRGVLVLPQLCVDQPVVRLDADLDSSPTVGPADVARVTGLLRAVVERFDLRAIYVHQLGGDPEPTIVTVRAMAGGVVHELVLCAAWYADLLDRTVGMEFAHRQ